MDTSEEYGPALPPGMQQSSGQNSSEKAPIGPSLPPGFIKQEPTSSPHSDNTEETSTAVAGIGPTAPGQEAGQQGADGTIGPLVSEMSHGDEVVQAAEEFERRSRKMKDQLTVKAEAQPGPSKREEWMTELPPEMGKNFGLTSRTFSAKGGAGSDDKDRSEWTDTPADKAKKEKDSKNSKKRKREEGTEKNVAKQRDQELQQQVEDYNKKKRPESLVEMHQKQKKKKKKKEKKKRKKEGKPEKKPERQPFDREKDLKANRFDEAQRKALIKRSQELNTRFAHSHTSSSFL